MHIAIEWHDKQFNIVLSSQQGKEPFLTLRGCRKVNGAKGEFISMPSTKNESTGKYWNHAIASDAFQKTILELVNSTQPQQSKPPVEDDLIPF